jgi:acetyl-CoA synthetase
MSGKNTGRVDSSLIENRIFYPTPEFAGKARVSSLDQRNEMWRKSIEKPDEFWTGIRNGMQWRNMISLIISLLDISGARS